MRTNTFLSIIAILFFFFLLTYSDTVTLKDNLTEKITKLEDEKQQIKDELFKSRLFRDSLYRVIDSLSASKKVILRSLKLVPVYVPGKFDTLKNEQLQRLMIEEYTKHK